VTTSVLDPTAAHEHDWRLLAVDFTGSEQVRELQCEACGDVLFA
jgi:hypothetical protein